MYRVFYLRKLVPLFLYLWENSFLGNLKVRNTCHRYRAIFMRENRCDYPFLNVISLAEKIWWRPIQGSSTLKRGKSNSIGYEFIVSISSALIVDWRWGKRALYSLLLSLLFIGALMILPAVIVQSANGISGEINSYTNNLVSDILPQGYTQSDMANVPGMSQFNPFPSLTTGSPMLDLSSQANALSLSVSGILRSLVYVTIILTVLFTLIFLLQVKRGIVLKTLVDTQIFYYPKRLEREAQEFINTVSATCMSFE